MIPGFDFPTFFSSALAPPLDLIGASATGAWGFRRLRTAYAGQCIRIRRSSDSTEQDIGFSGNLLDTAAITSFVGSNSAFVVTLYDQSGNARNLTQATASAQPRIVNAGTLDTLNGLPCCVFDGTDDVLAGTSTVANFFTASAYSIAFGARATAGTTGSNILGDRALYADTGGYIGGGFTTAAFRAGHYTSIYNNPTAALTPPETLVGLHRFGGGTINVYKNGGTPGQLTSVGNISATTGTMRLGQSFSSVWFQGSLSEIFFFNTEISAADANLICPSVAANVGVTWSNVT